MLYIALFVQEPDISTTNTINNEPTKIVLYITVNYSHIFQAKQSHNILKKELGVAQTNRILTPILKTTMVAKELEQIAQFQYFSVLCLPLPPYNVDLSRDMGSITWHWGTICPTQCLIFKIQHCSGGRGYRFHLQGDLLRRPLKG